MFLFFSLLVSMTDSTIIVVAPAEMQSAAVVADILDS